MKPHEKIGVLAPNRRPHGKTHFPFFFPFHPLQMFHTLSLLFSLSPTSKFAEAEWQLRNHGDDDGIFSISFHASASLFLSSFCHGFANFAFHRTVDRLVAVSSLEKW